MHQHDDGSYSPSVFAIGLGPAGVRELNAMRVAWPDHYGCQFVVDGGRGELDLASAELDLAVCFWDVDSPRAVETASKLEREATEHRALLLRVPLGAPVGDATAAPVHERVLLPQLGPGAQPGDVARTVLAFTSASLIDVVPDDVLAIYRGMTRGVVAVGRGELDVAPGLLRHLVANHVPYPLREVYLGGGAEMRMDDMRRVADAADSLAPDYGCELHAVVAEGLGPRQALVGVIATEVEEG